MPRHLGTDGGRLRSSCPRRAGYQHFPFEMITRAARASAVPQSPDADRRRATRGLSLIHTPLGWYRRRPVGPGPWIVHISRESHLAFRRRSSGYLEIARQDIVRFEIIHASGASREKLAIQSIRHHISHPASGSGADCVGRQVSQAVLLGGRAVASTATDDSDTVPHWLGRL